MLKTDDEDARATFRRLRKRDQVAHDFISFIHKNFPDEEANQYQADEWKQIALASGINKTSLKGLNKEAVIQLIRSTIPNYRELLRDSF